MVNYISLRRLAAMLLTTVIVMSYGEAVRCQQLIPLDQDGYRDSLLAISRIADKAAAADAACKLVEFYRIADTTKALNYLHLAQNMGNGQPNRHMGGKLAYYTGLYYKDRQNNRAAQEFSRAEKLLSGLNSPDSKVLKAKVLLNKAICEKDKIGYDKLVKTIVDECIPLLQEAGSTVPLADMYAQLGIIMTYNAAFADAGHYISKAIALLESAKPGSTDLFIAYMYMSANLCYQSKGTAASVYLEKGHKIIERYPAHVNQPFYYYNKMLVAISQQRNAAALDAAETGRSLAAKAGQVMLLQMFYFNEYDILKKLGKPEEARQMLLKTLADRRLVADIRNRKTVYREMATLLESAGNYPEALQWYKKYTATADTMQRQALDVEIRGLSAKFKATERERELKLTRAELANEKQVKLITVLGAGLLLVVAALLAIIFYNRQRFARERAQQLSKELIHAKERTALRVANALLEGEEAERARLARDLHDGVGATLTAAGMAVYAISTADAANKDLVELYTLVDAARQELRHVAHNIMPAAITEGNFKAALNQLCSYYTANGLAVTLHYEGNNSLLNNFEQSQLYRVVQELFTNILKHAEATEVVLGYTERDRRVEIYLRDNGKGMPEAGSEKGNGLINISQRIAYLNGEITKESAPGKGTTFTIKITPGGAI